jgi:hypothetical protein
LSWRRLAADIPWSQREDRVGLVVRKPVAVAAVAMDFATVRTGRDHDPGGGNGWRRPG